MKVHGTVAKNVVADIRIYQHMEILGFYCVGFRSKYLEGTKQFGTGCHGVFGLNCSHTLHSELSS